MRLSISSSLLLFVILVLASSIPIVSAGRGDADDIAFQSRVERMLAEHETRLAANDEFHRDIRESRIAERIARVEESQTINTRLQFAILIAVLGLLFRDFVQAFRGTKRWDFKTGTSNEN